MTSQQFTDHELSHMLLALDMALHDISKFEKDAKRKKDRGRALCLVMFIQIYNIRQKTKELLGGGPELISIEGGKK
jgi:hypothetical protein